MPFKYYMIHQAIRFFAGKAARYFWTIASDELIGKLIS